MPPVSQIPAVAGHTLTSSHHGANHQPGRNGATSPARSPPAAPALHQAEAKLPTSRMVISMATQGCHQQRIKLQQEGKRDQGEGG